MLKYFVLVGLILLCVTSAVASPFTTNIDPIIITTIVKGHGNIRIVLNYMVCNQLIKHYYLI